MIIKSQQLRCQLAGLFPRRQENRISKIVKRPISFTSFPTLDDNSGKGHVCETAAKILHGGADFLHHAHNRNFLANCRFGKHRELRSIFIRSGKNITLDAPAPSRGMPRHFNFGDISDRKWTRLDV